MASWDIMLNDEQRLALIEVLRSTNRGGNDDKDPLQYWVEMLTDLPKEDPGDWSNTIECRPGERKRMLHGFCL